MRVVFDDWLGLKHVTVTTQRTNYRISLPSAPEGISLPFAGHEIKRGTRPHVSPAGDLLARQDLGNDGTDQLIADDLPIIFWGDRGPLPPTFTFGQQCVELPFDLIGAASFMLTRAEEAVSPERDTHDRFPATASLAYQQGFLDRPIIDEYVEILWAVMKRLWPQLERKPRTNTMHVTCDVDSPCQVDYRLQAIGRDILTGAIRRALGITARTRISQRMRGRRGQCEDDPHFAMFDWMMDVNERAGNRMTFFFLAGGRDVRDGRYRLQDPAIRKLMRRIHDRGHEIGLHPSYQTYNDANATQLEADKLRKALQKMGIPSDALGSRQHYLRTHTPTTARNLEASRISYDSTLCYADRPGFRCGTSRDFQMFDIEENRPMKLVQRPLILMDCSVLGSHYMGMKYNDATLEYMCALKERALTFGGQFTLLWHNSYFLQPESQWIYQALIQ